MRQKNPVLFNQTMNTIFINLGRSSISDYFANELDSVFKQEQTYAKGNYHRITKLNNTTINRK